MIYNLEFIKETLTMLKQDIKDYEGGDCFYYKSMLNKKRELVKILNENKHDK